jgi:hypothetical protein
MLILVPTVLAVLCLGGLASSVPYLLLPWLGGAWRAICAYGFGLLVSSASSFGVFLTTQAVSPTSHNADGVIGSGLACTVIGPALGILAAKLARSKLQAGN